MVSVVAQERLLGAALGGALVVVLTLEERKSIYRSISATQENGAARYEEDDTARGSQLLKQGALSKGNSCSNLAHLWNTAVDSSFGSVISFLSSRGW